MTRGRVATAGAVGVRRSGQRPWRRRLRRLWRHLWHHPGCWALLSVPAAMSTFVVYFVGMFAGGHEVDESCARLGQPYDSAYRATHWEEPSRWFPLHNRCSAEFDLVPGWVNPALGCLALVTVTCVGLTLAAGVTRVATSVRRARRADAPPVDG